MVERLEMTCRREQLLGALAAIGVVNGCSGKFGLQKTGTTGLDIVAGNSPERIYKMDPLPTPEQVVLNKLAYGPRVGDIELVRRKGIAAYLEEQLNPVDRDDPLYNERIAGAKLPIEYEAGSEGREKWPSVKEDRPLNWIDKDVGELWTLVDGKTGRDWSEKVRPAEETRASTLLRAVYSKWQLREVLVQFWHNHFNVNIAKDEKIAALMPVYDRDVIRKNCLGNFRHFLEDVATSAAMGYYLDNAVSRASPANENYARELLELHTLGADNYLNHLYNRWNAVPGAASGLADGYIDQDVYEAARAFTGWTIADGSDNGKGENFPNTGKFYYYEGWHDNYQKRLLGIEFDPNQPPMADGRRVLDIVANHPATAYRICRKLCVRLVGDNPPQSLVKRAADVWTATKSHPDQIKEVVRTIALSPELLVSFGQKIKNPLELVISFLRATGAKFTPNVNLIWSLSQMGYTLFEYHAPTGHPDFGPHWLSTNVMANRWNTLSQLMSDWMEAAQFDLAAQHPTRVRSCREIATFWTNQLLGTAPPKHLLVLARFLSQGGNVDAPPEAEDDSDMKDRLNSMVALIAMLPEFQLR